MTSTVPLPGHASAPSGAIITTDIPARLDRLRWGRFHTLVVVALGITWILDGLEVTLGRRHRAGPQGAAREPAIHQRRGRAWSAAPISRARCSARSCFGWLTDRLGLQAAVRHHARALLWSPPPPPPLSWSSWRALPLFRFSDRRRALAANTPPSIPTIQELIPARYRGWTDLVINGSFWIGAASGRGRTRSSCSIPRRSSVPDCGSRARLSHRCDCSASSSSCHAHVDPRLPRWLMTHGRVDGSRQAMHAPVSRPAAARSGASLGSDGRACPVIRLRTTRAFTPLE